MKNQSLLALSMTLIFSISCGSHRTDRVAAPTLPPVESGNVADEVSAMPRASFNFILPELKCENILTFVDSYQRMYLPKANVKTSLDCVYSKDNLHILKSVQFYENEPLANLVFAVDSSEMKDLDKKPIGQVLVKWSNGIDTKLLDRLSEMFAKWVDMNSLTLRDACTRANIKAEECSLSAEL